MAETTGTIDTSELARFAAGAAEWWRSDGRFAALHRINPVRLGFIRSRLATHFRRDPGSLRPFTGLRLLDIGCGGGLVCEPMTRLGFAVTGLDAAGEAIEAAREHARLAGLAIDYVVGTAETLAAAGERFDTVLALEIVEHVADRDALLRSLGNLTAQGGAVIVSTLNRTLRAYALSILAAEYLLGWIPRGTHDWRKYVRPSELILSLRRHGLRPKEIVGLAYDPAAGGWSLGPDIGVNYLVFAAR